MLAKFYTGLYSILYSSHRRSVFTLQEHRAFLQIVHDLLAQVSGGSCPLVALRGPWEGSLYRGKKGINNLFRLETLYIYLSVT